LRCRYYCQTPKKGQEHWPQAYRKEMKTEELR